MDVLKTCYNKAVEALIFLTKKETLYKIATGALIVSSLVPNAALAVASAACRFFNQPALADRIEYERRKFVFIVVEHSLANLSDAPLEVLTGAKNLPKRSVIFSGEDLSVLEKMRTLFRETHAASPLKNVPTLKMDGMKAKGASFKLADGLALTGPYRFIQKCLEANITSENDLKKVGAQFEGGFDAEASTLQRIYYKMLPAYKDEPLEKVYDEFANCFGLKSNSMSNYSFPYDAAKFDSLANGLYWINFPKGYQKSHAVVLVKYAFGTYIFDPEFGLMSTKNSSPMAAFLKVAQAHNSQVDSCKVHHIVKK